MRLLKQRNQGGFTASFIVIAIVLFLGLASSVYFVKIHGDQVRKDQAIAVYEQQKTDETKTESGKKTTDSEEKSPTSANNASSNTSSSSSLPATGSEFIIIQLTGAGLFVMSASYYVLSRRDLVRYL